MTERLLELRESVRESARNRPGVYRMIAEDGRVVYVGKSVRVRGRLLSYFRAAAGEKAAEILKTTDRIEWDPVPSEFAALLRELRLIRRWRPGYNVEHKRSTGYSFVKVTREDAPRVLVVSSVAPDGSRYYGPFRGRRGVRDAVRELSDVLELRDCAAPTPMRWADQPELFHIESPVGCMRGELARCLAPCARRCDRSAYLARVALARDFLEGGSDVATPALERRMWAAAERLEFEHAGLLRERIERLRRLRIQLLMLWRESRELTVIYRVPGHEGEDRVYLMRRGVIEAELPAPGDEDGERELRERALRLSRAPAPPLHALDADRLAEMLLVMRWFRARPEERERTEPLPAPAPPRGAGRRAGARQPAGARNMSKSL